MGWPNNYVQGVYNSDNELVGVDDGAGGQIGLPNTISAEIFGFVDGADCTANFVAMFTYLASFGENYRPKVIFPAGVFYADKIEFINYVGNSHSSFNIVGAGKGATVWRAKVSSNSVFFSIPASAITNSVISGITLLGQAASNPLQDGLYVYSVPNSLINNTGGIWTSEFDLEIFNFDGSQIVFRGTQTSNGLVNGLPNQFLKFNFSAYRNAGNCNPTFRSIGQFGQVDFGTSLLDGRSASTCAGPNIDISIDYRYLNIQPTAEDTATDYWTSAAYFYPSCTPLRFIGANLPTTTPQVALGTTYFLATPFNNASTGYSQFKLSTSKSDVAAKSYINITAGGTPANYSFVPLWATGLASDEFTTEFNHYLLTGDLLRVRGASLPTGLSLATDYFVIRTGHKTFKLASSAANSLTGTSIAISGGTLTNFGFVVNAGISSGLFNPYSIDMSKATSQQAEIGMYFNGAHDINISSHFETVKRAIEVCNWSTINIDGGYYLSAASDSGSGNLLYVVGTSKASITGNPIVSGTTDKFITSAAASYVNSIEGSSFSPVFNAAISTTGMTSGITAQASVSTNAISIGHATSMIISPNTNIIKTITSAHLTDQVICAICWVGAPSYIEFDTTDNITGLGGATNVRLYEKAGATFQLRDLGAKWTLVGTSGEVYFYTPVAYSASITPVGSCKNVEVGILTGNITINTPTVAATVSGQTLNFHFTSDASARTPSWNAIFKGSPTNTASAANQLLSVGFRWNGSSWIKVFDTGWYTP